MSQKYLGVFLAILLLGLILVASFAIPHGLDVNRLELAYSQERTVATNLAGGAETVDSAQAYCESLTTLSSAIKRLPSLTQEYREVQARENLFRSAWKGLSYQEEDLNLLRKSHRAFIQELPASSDRLILALGEKYKQAFNAAVDVGEIQRIAGEFRAELERVQECYVLMSRFAETEETRSVLFDIDSIDPNVISRNQQPIQEVFLSGLNSLASALTSSHQATESSMESAPNVKQLVKLAKDHIKWLDDSRSTLVLLCDMDGTASQCKSNNRLIETAVQQTKSDLKLVETVVEAQNRSHQVMERALSKADRANASLNRLERYAKSSDVASVYQQWEAAAGLCSKSRRELDVRAGNKHQRAISGNLMRQPIERVERITSKVQAHRDFVLEKYREARREESSFSGSTARATRRLGDRFGRWLGKKTEEWSDTRMGRELGLSAKTLILGTKAFYDLMDPDSDPLTWAFAYQGDVEQLMNETDEIMRMEGPSLTGKNSFIEDLVNRAYEGSFEGAE